MKIILEGIALGTLFGIVLNLWFFEVGLWEKTIVSAGAIAGLAGFLWPEAKS
ncbi:MAG: hypothetical protein U1B30_15965 [Pseudomonadota bacterium]|nr:hypothetical protein [Pseudomonadota bacterium]